MSTPNFADNTYEERLKRKMSSLRWRLIHIDPPLFFSLVALAVMGLLILYSASNANMAMVEKQIIRLGIAFIVMIFFAQISPSRYRQWSPWVYALGMTMLTAVLVIGKVAFGAKRWLAFGPIRFQPSEITLLALPMAVAWYLSEKRLPPKAKSLIIASLLLGLPVLLTAKQPDLGTAIIIASAGLSVLLFAGISWRLVGGLTLLSVLSAPVLWHFMHDYQKQRVLTFLNPERDPLGSGYHIIQSKIAIGSGGVIGKGWLNGTQSHLSFLPAHATDFIFAVNGEELGLIGSIILLILYMIIFARCLYISSQAQDTFSRLLAGSLSLTFIFSAFVNIGMVIGILPVVGIPLPLISYGGTSMVTLLAGFGIIMSIQTHKKLWPS